MREFEFELRLCAHLETRDAIVGRQLGAGVGRWAGTRVIDVVRILAGPEMDDRLAISSETIPHTALDAQVSVAEWRPVTSVFDAPPARAREIADEGVASGFLERTRRDGRDVIRQSRRYPAGWYDTIVGIENKPDLGSPGDLEAQLRTDVSLAVFDRVVLATQSYVTGAHRNRLPPEVGLWRMDFQDPDPITVLRDPEPLPVDQPGLQIVNRRPERAEIRIASAEEKAVARRRIAERAYGRGWRPALPSCDRVERGSVDGATALPYCEWYGRVVDPGRECGPSCPGYRSGEPPPDDRRAEREQRQAWRDVGGSTRRQSSLDRF